MKIVELELERAGCNQARAPMRRPRAVVEVVKLARPVVNVDNASR